MKQPTQRIVIAFLLIVVTALSLQTCFRKETENALLKDIVEIKQDSTEYWKDLWGQEHAQKKLSEGNYSSLRAAYRNLLDSVKTRVGANSGDLEGVTTAGTVTTGKIRPVVDTVYLPDSTRILKFSYNDRWLDLAGIVGKDPIIDYRFTDTIVFTTYRKKTGFLKKHTYIDGYSLNPNVRITGITGIRVNDQRPHRFSIGPYLGYGWNGDRWAPSAGVSVQLSLIKF